MTEIGIAILATILCGLLLLFVRYSSLWLQAFFAGSHISYLSLVLMTLRKVDPKLVVRCKVRVVQAGLTEISINAIESQILSGGNVERVTLALIAADRANIDLDWNNAACIDLAGRDIVEAVQVSVNTKVIDCPNPLDAGGATLDGIAKDGVQLKVRVRVTVRTDLPRLVGGATESTVIARVGQSIISAIGSCESYRHALRDPMLISRKVLAQGLDSQTAFHIVSIDIAGIDVGENIGAKLRIDQADADIRIARAAAESRRAMATAKLQEMTAQRMGHLANLIRSEAKIPQAISLAFRVGQFQSKASIRHSPPQDAFVNRIVKAVSAQETGKNRSGSELEDDLRR